MQRRMRCRSQYRRMQMDMREVRSKSAHEREIIMDSLTSAFARAINGHSAENVSNTPDFILAAFAGACLDAFNAAVQERDRWYGYAPRPGSAPTEEDVHRTVAAIFGAVDPTSIVRRLMLAPSATLQTNAAPQDDLKGSEALHRPLAGLAASSHRPDATPAGAAPSPSDKSRQLSEDEFGQLLEDLRDGVSDDPTMAECRRASEAMKVAFGLLDKTRAPSSTALATDPANPERRSSLELSEVKPDGSSDRVGEKSSGSGEVGGRHEVRSGSVECGPRAAGQGVRREEGLTEAGAVAATAALSATGTASAGGTTDQAHFFKGIMAGWPGMEREEDRKMMESILAVLEGAPIERRKKSGWCQEHKCPMGYCNHDRRKMASSRNDISRSQQERADGQS